jgi:hypothetical protein
VGCFDGGGVGAKVERGLGGRAGWDRFLCEISRLVLFSV